jgi:hypothetical protein
MGKYAIYIVSALIFSMLTYSSALRNALFISNSRMVESHSINQAQNIAQSALMVAVKDIMTNGGDSSFHPDEDEEYSYPSANGFSSWNELHGAYNIRTINQGDTLLTVQATGRFDDASYEASIGLRKIPPTGGGFLWPDLDKAVYSEETIDLASGTIYGDVYTEEDIIFNNNGQVYGKVFAKGNISLNNGDIHGDTYVGENLFIDGNNAVNGDVYSTFDGSGKVLEFGWSGGSVNGNFYTNSTENGAIDYSKSRWNSKITGDLVVGPGGNPDNVKTPKKTKPWEPELVQGSNSSAGSLLPEVSFPPPDVPEFPTPPSTPISLSPITLGGSDSHYLDLSSGNAYMSSMTINSNTRLTINVGNNDRTLRLDQLNINQGHIDVISEGEGKLQMFVGDRFHMGGSSSINNNSNPGGNEKSPKSVLIAYSGSEEVDFTGNKRVNANLFLKEADFYMGGSTQMKGNIIATGENYLQFDGGTDNISRLIFAPNGHVSLGSGGGSSSVKGSIYAKRFSGPSNYTLTYSEDFEDTLPDIGSGGNEGEATFQISFWN